MRILGHRKDLQALKIVELFINLLYQNHICENRRMSILMRTLLTCISYQIMPLVLTLGFLTFAPI